MNRHALPKGFTLIELLVVIAILGILATGLMVMINPLARIQQAQDTQRKNDLNELQHALQLYYQDYGHYPYSSNGQICPQIGTCLTWGGNWTPYIQKIPTDPAGLSYYYVADPNGTQYKLYAHIQQYQMDAHTCNSAYSDTSCNGAAAVGAYCGPGITSCNYGVSSPNVSP